MALNLETATFEDLVLRNSRGGKFENVDAPLLLSQACTAPFGVELDSQFAPLPIFAGGNDPRKHLTVQLELTEEEAQGLRRLDSACEAASLSTGTWSPLVTLREGRHFAKARIIFESGRATTFRVEEGELQSGWDALQPLLLQHRNLRGARLKVALRAMYVWCVNGKRGLTLGADQLVIEMLQCSTLDHFRT
jgi:hypothetical protein